jgi:hypothetical protein
MFLLALALALVSAGIVAWRLARTSEGRSGIEPASLRLIPLPLVSVAMQFVALRWDSSIERIVLFTLSQALLILFFVANLRHAPLRLLAFGFALNLLPMLLNGGYMPITPEAMAGLHSGTTAADWASGLVRAGSKDIVLSASQARLGFLGDVFVLAKPFPLPMVFSIGDVFILIGFVWTLSQISLPGVQYETH